MEAEHRSSKRNASELLSEEEDAASKSSERPAQRRTMERIEQRHDVREHGRFMHQEGGSYASPSLSGKSQSPQTHSSGVTDLLSERQYEEASRSRMEKHHVTNNAKQFNHYTPLPNLNTIKPKVIPFQQPTQLISFSYTEDHVQEFTDSALRYYVDPPIGASLSYGVERWVRKPDTRGRIDALLKAISKIKNEQRGPDVPQVGLVSWRGVMSKILLAPYERFEGWELNVMYVNGTLYLEEHLSEERLKEKNNMDARQRSQTYYGYAFESYCTAEIPPSQRPPQRQTSGVPQGWGGDVNTNVQWCSVVRTKLGDMRMVIGGEVDCVRGKYTGQTDTFVELKTSLAIRGDHDEAKFERKLLKFYLQSFLLGVPEIIVGFRTPAGIITTVQSFKTMQLPRLVRGKSTAWDPLVCLDWGYEFLTSLQKLIRQAGSGEGDLSASVWRVKFTPGSGAGVDPLDIEGLEDVANGEDRVGFLPRWYWNEIRQGSLGKQSDTPAVPPLASAGWQI